MKILLAYLCHYADRHDYYMSLLPVGLTTLAAHLQKKGHEVILANFSRLGYRKSSREIAQIKPEVLGLSLYTHNRLDTLKLVRAVKIHLPRCRIILGGPHATHLADEILKRYPEVDYIIAGEGETALENLLKALAGGKKSPERIIESPRPASVNTLPRPGEFSGKTLGVDPNEQFKYIITTRGCPQKCSFCCSPAFWKRRVRYRSPENILREIRLLYHKYGIIYFSIRDDNFTLDKKRVMEFSRLLQESGMYLMWNCQSRVDSVDREMIVQMKQAGLEHIQFGVETGSPRILERYDKNITLADIEKASLAAREAGVYLSVYLMTGMRGETAGDTKKTIQLIRRILPGDGIVSPVALYPGTALYEEEKAAGRISDAYWFQNSDSGVFLRQEEIVNLWMRDILNELSLIREKSWYRNGDFRLHRKHSGSDCWVTDILEGDYYLDEERYTQAEACYERVMTKYPKNPWGFLRMGKLKFEIGEFDGAVGSYHAVTRLVPAYYGGWLKLAESQIALGSRKSARRCIDEAYKRNSFDFRIQNLMILLK